MMSTSKKQDAKNPTATPNRMNVAKAVARAYATMEDQSNIVTQVCNSAAAAFKGEAIQKHDMEAIVKKVAKLRKWSEASRKARASEMRAVLKQYDRLPDAIKAYKAKAPDDGFTWHTAIKLARCLTELSIDEAITEMFAEATDSTPTERRMVSVTGPATKDYDIAVTLAKAQFKAEKPSEAIAAVLHWYVESQSQSIAA